MVVGGVLLPVDGPLIGTGLCWQGFFKPTIIRLMSDLTGGRDKCVRQMKVRCPGGGGTWWGGCLTCVVAQVTNIRCPRRFGAVCAKCHTLDDVCPILDFTGRTYAELVTYACSVLYVTPLGLYVGGSVPVVTSGSAANTTRIPAPGTGCGKGISATWCVVAWHTASSHTHRWFARACLCHRCATHLAVLSWQRATTCTC